MTAGLDWLRAAPRLVGHLFPRLLAQSQYNTRLRQIAPLMDAALRCQRLLALNACIWHNWQIGAPVKRSLIAHDHV